MTKRLHDESAAGGGFLGIYDEGARLGECPSCKADLHVGLIEHPVTGLSARVIIHPMPFCTYYAETDPDEIARAIVKARQANQN
jgi:hypothetical protein